MIRAVLPSAAFTLVPMLIRIISEFIGEIVCMGSRLNYIITYDTNLRSCFRGGISGNVTLAISYMTAIITLTPML